MPTWRTELPKEKKHMGFDLRRTPQTATLHAIVTSDDLLVCDTHFWKGRTQPCERPDCPACNESTPYRTHVYLSAFDPKKAEHFLFECTAHAAKPLDEYRQANQTMRGCIILANRPKGTRNSKVFIQTATANLTRVHLPDPPDLILALSVIWRLPATALQIGQAPRGHDELQAKLDIIAQQREQPDNMPDPPTIGEILSGNNRPQSKEPAA